MRSLRSLLPPILLLLLMAGFTGWHSRSVEADTGRWVSQLERIDALAESGDWPQVRAALADSYTDWQDRRTYLNIMTPHDMVNAAESMYCRARTFALEEDPIEFRAELAGLMSQLRTLAEAESFLPENIL